MTILTDERQRSKLSRQDIDVLARKLRRIIDLASALDEHKLNSFAKRLELDLQLTEAEATLLYAGYDSENLERDRVSSRYRAVIAQAELEGELPASLPHRAKR